MNRDEIKKAVADTVVSFAKEEADAALKAIDFDDLQQLIEAQMKNLTDPLETEIHTTTSWWVKIRNRLYITLMQQAIKAIVADVKQKIA
ncbi:hypothetical protein [Megasphaera sp.]|jgi:hypothetical protein|uniref:hypothetical protein n=1 Tax=Megasphaera sp. TaxID=2023260 RepID=UPI003FEFC878